MTVGTERRGLGRGLGELFQKTELPPPPPPAGDGGSRWGESRETVPTGSDPWPGRRGSTDDGLGLSDRPSTAAQTATSAGERPPSDPQLGAGDPGRDPLPVPTGSSYLELPPEAITPNPRQPRTVFAEEELRELIESIAEVGLLQPIVVRPLGDDRYELVMGERRWRASRQAGLARIPAIVRRTEDHDLLRDALLENLHRVQLNPLEEAAAYQQMLDDFSCTHDELASRVKRSRSQISNTIRLLRLPPTIQRRVAAGVLSAGHARAILGLTDPAQQEKLAQRVAAEGLSVRAVEEIVAVGQDAGAAPARRARAQRPVSGRASELAARLSDHLETRVRVEMGRSKGRIVVEFAAADDLDRIIEAMRLPVEQDVQDSADPIG